MGPRPGVAWGDPGFPGTAFCVGVWGCRAGLEGFASGPWLHCRPADRGSAAVLPASAAVLTRQCWSRPCPPGLATGRPAVPQPVAGLLCWWGFWGGCGAVAGWGSGLRPPPGAGVPWRALVQGALVGCDICLHSRLGGRAGVVPPPRARGWPWLAAGLSGQLGGSSSRRLPGAAALGAVLPRRSAWLWWCAVAWFCAIAWAPMSGRSFAPVPSPRCPAGAGRASGVGAACPGSWSARRAHGWLWAAVLP